MIYLMYCTVLYCIVQCWIGHFRPAQDPRSWDWGEEGHGVKSITHFQITTAAPRIWTPLTGWLPTMKSVLVLLRRHGINLSLSLLWTSCRCIAPAYISLATPRLVP